MEASKSKKRASRRRPEEAYKNPARTVLASWIKTTLNFFNRMTGKLGTLILIIAPFICVITGEQVYAYRGYFAFGGEWVLASLLVFFGFFLRAVKSASDIQSIGVPAARRRFTSEDGSGQVDVDYDRLQEMILYVADIEDWLEDSGYEYK